MLWSVLLLHPYIFPLLQYRLSLLSCSLSRKKKSGSVFSGNSHFLQVGLSHEFQGICPPFWVLPELQGICALVQRSTTSTSDFGVLSTVSHSSPCTASPFLPVQLFFLSLFKSFHRGATNKFGSALACSEFILKLWPTVGLYWSQLEGSVRHRRATGLPTEANPGADLSLPKPSHMAIKYPIEPLAVQLLLVFCNLFLD